MFRKINSIVLKMISQLGLWSFYCFFLLLCPKNNVQTGSQCEFIEYQILPFCRTCEMLQNHKVYTHKLGYSTCDSRVMTGRKR